jgi:dihydrofolate reductase
MLIYQMMMTLDGRVARPDGALDWVQIDAELHDFVNSLQAGVDTYILGRKTYEMMEAFWPAADQDPNAPGYVNEYSRIWKAMPKLVVSTTLEQVGPRARLIEGDAATEIAALKAQPGKDLSIGGPALAASVIDLVDEFHIFVNPVLIGQGVPLVADLRQTLDLQLLECRAFDLGVVFLRYLRKRGA